jgi:hypothetical protein
MGQVGRGLDLGDRGKADSRILDLTREEAPDLLPEQLVDPIGPSRHRSRLALDAITWLAPG